MSVLNSLSSFVSESINASNQSIATNSKYSRLGSYADKIDKTAQRSYYEQGYQKFNSGLVKNNQLGILLQEPDATLLIKKRAFSSLAENYNNDTADYKESLFLRTVKTLFRNKCNQIAAFERLTKIEKVASSVGYLDPSLLALVVNLLDSYNIFDNAFNIEPSASIQKFKKDINKLRKAITFSQRNTTTNFVKDLDRSVVDSQFDEGTGVIELTTFSFIGTTTSITAGGGNMTATFIDPYNLFSVTNLDIDIALDQVLNTLNSSNFTQIGLESLQNIINTNIQSLNNLRRSRHVYDIIFNTVSGAFTNKKLTALIDNLGFEILFTTNSSGVLFSNGTNIDELAKYNEGGIGAGIHGLNDKEASLFSDIVSGTLKLYGLKDTLKNQTMQLNEFTSEIRQKLRLYHGGGKLIIQPMDVFHVYFASKSKEDKQVLSGMQSEVNGTYFANQSSKIIENIANLSQAQDYAIQKSIVVGDDFNDTLWKIMRNNFINTTNGAHAISGVIKSASSSYNGGFYNVSITGDDNFSYFDKGIVNMKPAVEVYNGELLNPLTPYELKFDNINGDVSGKLDLIPENKALLKSSFSKIAAGPHVGKFPTEANISEGDSVLFGDNLNKLTYGLSSFVYKWKSGIATCKNLNYNSNTSKDSNLSITNDPFAGQDVMNVISLLVTGEPYNYINYINAVKTFDTLGSTSYFRSLSRDLKKRNSIYGNFIPFKKISVDYDTNQKLLQSQLNIVAYNGKIRDLVEQRKSLTNSSLILNGSNEALRNTDIASQQLKQIYDIDTQLASIQESIKKQVTLADTIRKSGNNKNLPLSFIGNNFDIMNDVGGDINAPPATLKNKQNTQKKRNNYLTQRLLWQVKANEDKNLFIVDDNYDKNLDIQVVEKSFVDSFSLFNSDYCTVKDKITTFSRFLDFEVFADTQGHIQVRVPQYNKLPSSVFYNMLRLKRDKNITLYPKFMEELFTKQLDSAFSDIEINENLIRLYCAYLGKITDADIKSFVKGSIDGLGNSNFSFLTDENSGKFWLTSSVLVNDLDNPDFFDQQVFNNINTQANLTNVFDTISQINALTSFLSVTKDTSGGKVKYVPAYNDNNNFDYLSQDSNRSDRIDSLMEILNRFGITSSALIGDKKVTPDNYYEIIKNIGNKISERQILVKNVKNNFNSLKNKKLDKSNLFDNLFISQNVPPILKSMIEDEEFDDLGIGSGKRYVIKDNQIKDMNFNETMPELTSVTVNGSFADLYVKPPSEFNTATGNLLTSVLAVDYDLWRMYGSFSPHAVDAPFLKDPETQGAPFAVAVLNKVRGNILQGRMTITGNEYIQPGEVYYIESKDMLYYSTSVTHSYKQGSAFTTAIEFKYGHNPGEYIPTYFDLVGKSFYKNKPISESPTYPAESSLNQENINALYLNDATSFDTQENRKKMEDLSLLLTSVFANSTPINNKNLEIRCYYNSKSTNKTDITYENIFLKGLAFKLKDILIGKDPDIKMPANISFSQYADNIIVKSYDISKQQEFRYASSMAYSLARKNVPRGMFSNNENEYVQKIDSVLYQNVIDCWIVG